MWVVQRVRTASTVVELRTALGQLEASLHDEYVSTQFKRKPAPVKGAWVSTGPNRVPRACHSDVWITGALGMVIQVDSGQ